MSDGGGWIVYVGLLILALIVLAGALGLAGVFGPAH